MKGDNAMYMQFVKQTFGLEHRPRAARLIAVAMPVVMFVGGVLVFFRG
jgi:hypothetical protein